MHPTRVAAASAPGVSSREAVAVALFALLPLAVLPGLRDPFSSAKLAVLCAGAVAAAGLALLRPVPPESQGGVVSALALGWLLATVLSALRAGAAEPRAFLRDAAAALLLCALPGTVRASPVLRASAAAGALLALVVLAQAAGLDPFAAHAHGRLALYGTQGNPDAVAGFLGAALPLAVVEAGLSDGPARTLLAGAAALEAVALVLTGSFATLLALGAAALLLSRHTPRAALWLAAALIACGGWALRRDAREAVAGRLYLHRVAAPHLLDAPLLGAGPGATEALWPGWELQRWKSGREEPDALRLAAAQDHVHDDWLEKALEVGLPGALCLAALAAAAVGVSLRGGAPRSLGCGAALAGLCARAFVDFPLARPAELGAFALLAALACRTSEVP